jgi:hypothetical protein
MAGLKLLNLLLTRVAPSFDLPEGTGDVLGGLRRDALCPDSG